MYVLGLTLQCKKRFSFGTVLWSNIISKADISTFHKRKTLKFEISVRLSFREKVKGIWITRLLFMIIGWKFWCRFSFPMSIQYMIYLVFIGLLVILRWTYMYIYMKMRSFLLPFLLNLYQTLQCVQVYFA